MIQNIDTCLLECQQAPRVLSQLRVCFEWCWKCKIVFTRNNSIKKCHKTFSDKILLLDFYFLINLVFRLKWYDLLTIYPIWLMTRHIIQFLYNDFPFLSFWLISSFSSIFNDILRNISDGKIEYSYVWYNA